MSEKKSKEVEQQTCGVIMPISAIDGCDQKHWQDVKEIIFSAIDTAGMLPNLVSDDVEVGVIHKRIVQNIFENVVVVCDISAKNPNVMLELGMRLAFDKPVIVVKDDKTAYSFDASPIEHLSYPRDLHYQSIIEFQGALAKKIEAMRDGGNGHSFLKSFGTFKTATLEQEAGTPIDLVMEELSVIKAALRAQDSPRQRYATKSDSRISTRFLPSRKNETYLTLCLHGEEEKRSYIAGAIKSIPYVTSLHRKIVGSEHEHFEIHYTQGEKHRVSDGIRAITDVFDPT